MKSTDKRFQSLDILTATHSTARELALAKNFRHLFSHLSKLRVTDNVNEKMGPYPGFYSSLLVCGFYRPHPILLRGSTLSSKLSS